jgi:hypothetical protein
LGGGVGAHLPFSLSSIFYSWLFSLLVFVIYFDETDSKQPKIPMKIHTSLWILKISRKNSKEPRVSRLLPNVRDFQEEIDTLGNGF